MNERRTIKDNKSVQKGKKKMNRQQINKKYVENKLETWKNTNDLNELHKTIFVSNRYKNSKLNKTNTH